MTSPSKKGGWGSSDDEAEAHPVHQPPSKNGGLVKPLPFGKFGRRFNPPPPQKGGDTLCNGASPEGVCMG